MRRAIRPALLAGLALTGCATGTKAAESPAHAAQDLFGLPPIVAPLVFPPETREVTLGWLVDELARLSGQELTMEVELRRTLDATVEPLELMAPVPAGEVYAFVEALLSTHGIVIAPAKGGARPVLGLYGGQGPRQGEPRPVPIEPAHIAALAGHPALLVQVLLTFENIDSRQLQTQLRQLFADTSGLQQVVPAGERSLILQAHGTKLLGLVQLLQDIDRASQQRERAPAESASEPSQPQPGQSPRHATAPRTQ